MPGITALAANSLFRCHRGPLYHRCHSSLHSSLSPSAKLSLLSSPQTLITLATSTYSSCFFLQLSFYFLRSDFSTIPTSSSTPKPSPFSQPPPSNARSSSSSSTSFSDTPLSSQPTHFSKKPASLRVTSALPPMHSPTPNQSFPFPSHSYLSPRSSPTTPLLLTLNVPLHALQNLSPLWASSPISSSKFSTPLSLLPAVLT